MILSYACILLITAVALLIWCHGQRKRKAEEFALALKDNNKDSKSSISSYSINKCNATFCEVIDTIIAGDKSQICRLLRLFDFEYDKFEQFWRQTEDKEIKDCIYVKYLWETTLKLVESGRNMIVHPEYDCTAKEIKGLFFWATNLPNADMMTLPEIAERCKENKDKISETIREYSNNMRHKDYEEGCQKYNFLLLLFYIYSFMMALDNLMKPHRTTQL